MPQDSFTPGATAIASEPSDRACEKALWLQAAGQDAFMTSLMLLCRCLLTLTGHLDCEAVVWFVRRPRQALQTCHGLTRFAVAPGCGGSHDVPVSVRYISSALAKNATELPLVSEPLLRTSQAAPEPSLRLCLLRYANREHLVPN